MVEPSYFITQRSLDAHYNKKRRKSPGHRGLCGPR